MLRPSSSTDIVHFLVSFLFLVKYINPIRYCGEGDDSV